MNNTNNKFLPRHLNFSSASSKQPRSHFRSCLPFPQITCVLKNRKTLNKTLHMT